MRARLLSAHHVGLWAVVSAALFAPLQPAAAACMGSTAFESVPSHVHTPGACDLGPPCSSDIGSSVTSSLAGAFWRIGFGAGASNGGFPALAETGGWLVFDSGSPAVVSSDWNADVRIDGCIDQPPTFPRCMALAFSDQLASVGYFALVSAENDPAWNYDFSQEGGAPIVLAPIPRPLATRAQRFPGGRLILTLKNGAVPQEGLYLDGPSCDDGMIVGYRIYRPRHPVPNQAPVDRKLADWELVPGGAGPGGQPIPLGTTTEVEFTGCESIVYLALTLVFESGFETQHVSYNAQFNLIDGLNPDHDCDGFCGFCESPDVPVDCNDSDPAIHPGATEVCNGADDNCNGLVDENAAGLDTDGDGVGNACDNCVLDRNVPQSDIDHDSEGDVCDLDDGLIFVYGTDDKNYVEWQAESGYMTWNSYRGSLGVLRASGQYTQAPESNPLAARDCGLGDASAFDPMVPAAGEVAFSLVTGVAAGVESGLGTNGTGAPRANANPCP